MSLTLRDGRPIARVLGVGHSTHDGVADWWYRIAMDDGWEPTYREMAPYHVCGEPADINPLSELCMVYLRDRGRWLEKTKFMKDGRAVAWEAKQPSGYASLKSLREFKAKL